MSDEGGGASRSTDPAAGSSAATDVSLREFLTSAINAAEWRSDARFESMKATVEAAFKNSQEAIKKADYATEKRFEGVNEFRSALSDQAQHFVTKETLNALVDKLSTQIERNRDDLDSLAKRIDVREGQTQGSRITWGNMVALIASSAAVLGIVIVLANYISSH